MIKYNVKLVVWDSQFNCRELASHTEFSFKRNLIQCLIKKLLDSVENIENEKYQEGHFSFGLSSEFVGLDDYNSPRFNAYFTLDPEIIKRLVELRLAIDYDPYL